MRYKKLFSLWYPSAAVSDGAKPIASNGRKEGFRTADRSDCKGTVRLDGCRIGFQKIVVSYLVLRVLLESCLGSTTQDTLAWDWESWSASDDSS